MDVALPDGPLAWMTLTVMTFVPTELYVAVARLPVVVADGGFASLPKFHSYRRIVDVAPDTVAVKMTVSSLAGFEFDAVMMTPGGCCGRIVAERHDGFGETT
jgi:hypothetical protein